MSVAGGVCTLLLPQARTAPATTCQFAEEDSQGEKERERGGERERGIVLYVFVCVCFVACPLNHPYLSISYVLLVTPFVVHI